MPVSGQVLIDGQPLTCGHVQFILKGARPSGGVLDEKGQFVLKCFEKDDGAVPGLHTVVVFGNQPLNSFKTLWHAPKKYTDASTSGIQQEITGPTDSVVINLTWAGGKPFLEDDETGAIEPYKPEVHKPAK
ncbi:MAG: hypothetical protein WD468_11385 [Pirellulales bacterium]